jgi:hypothetical protein
MRRGPGYSRAIAAATFTTVAVLGIVLGPPQYNGDESEYLSMTYALATNGNPTLTPTLVNAIRAAHPSRPLGVPNSVKAIDGTDDALHFWFLSALAAPFFLLCKAVGLDWEFSFILVNAIAFAVAVGVTSFYFQLRGAVLLLIGLSASPLLPYLNKAHGEAFSVSLLTMAGVFLAQGNSLAAALATSFISAQVSAFSPLAAALLVYWEARAWIERRRPARRELAIVTVCGCLLVLQPLWTLWRHHTLNLIVATNFVKPELVNLRRVAGILIDPDIGLLFSWPVGVLLSLVTMIGLWRNPALVRNHLAYWVFVTGTTAYLSIIGAQQTNYLSVYRYSFWFLPLCLISLLLVYERESGGIKGARGFAGVILVVCIAGAAANFWIWPR